MIGLKANAFAVDSAENSFTLPENEVKQFMERGWAGPYKLLSRTGVEQVTETCAGAAGKFCWSDLASLPTEESQFDKFPWFKSMHAYLPEVWDCVSHPAVVDRLATLFASDLMVWGTTTTTRQPGQRHRWHVDVEHLAWDGITMFLGLKNTCPESSLQVIEGSHRFSDMPQSLGIDSDDQAIRAAMAKDPAAKLVTVELNEGEFFFFHGRLWHGSNNSGTTVRTALVAQYAKPADRAMVPLRFDEPLAWHEARPPCILVSGTDGFGVNRMVAPPRTKIGFGGEGSPPSNGVGPHSKPRNHLSSLLGSVARFCSKRF